MREDKTLSEFNDENEPLAPALRWPILLVLLAGCASWAPTLKAQIRREAQWRLESCIGHLPALRHVSRSPFLVRECKAEVREWCAGQGMEADCGEIPDFGTRL